MKKIIIITQYFLPETVGRASRVHQLGKYFKKNHQVKIISPPPSYPFTKFKKAKYLFRNEKINDLDVLRLSTYQPNTDKPSFFQYAMYYLRFSFLTSIYLLTHFQNISTIIFITPPSPILLSTLVARILRKKVVIDIGDLWETVEGFEPKYKFLRKKMKNFEIRTWKKSDLIITNHKYLQNRIKKILNNAYPKVEYFPYQVDLDLLKKQDVKREKQIVYLGNFGFSYNFKVLIEAMSLIIKKIPDLKLEFYGGGSSEPEMKKIAKGLGLDYCINFNGLVEREQIPLIFSKSLLGLIPLYANEKDYSIFPTKTFEYLSCSLPVFAFGPSGLLEKVIKESEGGVFIPSNDHKEIANELIKLLNDEKILENLAVNARKFVEKTSNRINFEKLI